MNVPDTFTARTPESAEAPEPQSWKHSKAWTPHSLPELLEKDEYAAAAEDRLSGAM